MLPLRFQTRLTYIEYDFTRFHRIENILTRENLTPLPTRIMGVAFLCVAFTYLLSCSTKVIVKTKKIVGVYATSYTHNGSGFLMSIFLSFRLSEAEWRNLSNVISSEVEKSQQINKLIRPLRCGRGDKIYDVISSEVEKSQSIKNNTQRGLRVIRLFNLILILR